MLLIILFLFFIAVKLSPLASSPSPSLRSRSSSRSPIRYVQDDTLAPNGEQSPRGASPPMSPMKSSSDEAEEEQPPPPPPPQPVSISASKKRKASGTPSTTSTIPSSGNFLNDLNIRGVGDGWAGRAIAHPGFGRLNNLPTQRSAASYAPEYTILELLGKKFKKYKS